MCDAGHSVGAAEKGSQSLTGTGIMVRMHRTVVDANNCRTLQRRGERLGAGLKAVGLTRGIERIHMAASSFRQRSAARGPARARTVGRSPFREMESVLPSRTPIPGSTVQAYAAPISSIPSPKEPTPGEALTSPGGSLPCAPSLSQAPPGSFRGRSKADRQAHRRSTCPGSPSPAP